MVIEKVKKRLLHKGCQNFEKSIFVGLKERSNILATAVRTLEMEAEAIRNLASLLDDQFEEVIRKMEACKGRIIITGIGKSAIIAQKIVATLNSTGSPALFLHAADAIHGDLGVVQQDDLVMVISKSGESPEIKVLVPLIRNFKNVIVGMVGNMRSYLAKNCDFVLNTTVDQEACPNNLAPTTSTTAQLAMGDALAVCLMEKKGFAVEDFAKFHPGGALGKKLYLRVADLCAQHEKPSVMADRPVKEAIMEITRKRLGMTAVMNGDHIVGVITDGDLRRMLEKTDRIDGITARDIMSVKPKTIQAAELAVSALDLMRKHEITTLIVLDNEEYAGIIHLHDLIKEGLL